MRLLSKEFSEDISGYFVIVIRMFLSTEKRSDQSGRSVAFQTQEMQWKYSGLLEPDKISRELVYEPRNVLIFTSPSREVTRLRVDNELESDFMCNGHTVHGGAITLPNVNIPIFLRRLIHVFLKLP